MHKTFGIDGTNPAELDFLDYYKTRRERIRQRLSALLSRTSEMQDMVSGSPA